MKNKKNYIKYIRKIIFCCFLTSTTSYADETFGAYGIGAFNSAKNARAEVKAINLGYRSEIYNGFYWQYKIGYWGEGSGDERRKSSFYISIGPGLTIDLKPIELRSGWGIGAISNPDNYLGGRFPQFNGELYAGLRDRKNNGIGIKYEHISSASLIQPNIGRDFILLELSQKW